MRDTPTPSIDVLALLRERRYLVLLIIVAILAVPIAAAAYWFLYLVSDMQKWVFNPAYLPKALGFHGEPTWWPLPMLTLVRCPRRVDHQVLARPGGGGLTRRRVPCAPAAVSSMLHKRRTIADRRNALRSSHT